VPLERGPGRLTREAKGVYFGGDMTNEYNGPITHELMAGMTELELMILADQLARFPEDREDRRQVLLELKRRCITVVEDHSETLGEEK